MTFGAFLSGETPHWSCHSFAVAHLGEVKREYAAIRCCMASILFVAWEKPQSEYFIKPQIRWNWLELHCMAEMFFFIHWLFPLLHRTLENWQESGERGIRTWPRPESNPDPQQSCVAASTRLEFSWYPSPIARFPNFKRKRQKIVFFLVLSKK